MVQKPIFGENHENRPFDIKFHLGVGLLVQTETTYNGPLYIFSITIVEDFHMIFWDHAPMVVVFATLQSPKPGVICGIEI